MAERRPIATRNTAWAQSLATRVATSGISANAVSVTGVVFALAAGAAYLASCGAAWRAWFVVAAGCIQLRLLCNMIDGMVAVEHGDSTPTGALYNDVPDRLADTVILVTAGYAVDEGTLGWVCAVVAMLTAYVRALGGALGTPQFFCGPLAKSQRMAVLTIASLVAAFLPDRPLAARLMVAALLIVLVGAMVTVVRRLRLIAAELNSRGA